MAATVDNDTALDGGRVVDEDVDLARVASEALASVVDCLALRIGAANAQSRPATVGGEWRGSLNSLDIISRSAKTAPGMPAPEEPAHVKAHATGRWAEIIFRALSSRVASRWKFVSFRGANEGEWRGVVDLIAIRKNTAQPPGDILKRGDLFDIVLIQVKGGSAPAPSENDCRRLREVGRLYRARAIAQFQWRKGESSKFFELGRDLKWKPTTRQALFE